MTVEFVPLKGFEDDYEIMSEYPFTIRRKSDQYEISEWNDKKGYICVKLNSVKQFKHRLIAKQFIENDDPEHKTQVDHINHDRSDYHLTNLRWVTPSENQKNKSSHKGVVYEFVDDIPEDAIVVDFYDTRNDHYEFDENHYYYVNNDGNDIFYAKIDGNLYKILHINTRKGGSQCVNMNDINGKKVNVYINRFRYQHDL